MEDQKSPTWMNTVKAGNLGFSFKKKKKKIHGHYIFEFIQWLMMFAKLFKTQKIAKENFSNQFKFALKNRIVVFIS